MKSTPENLTLDGIMAHFDTDEKARDYLEGIRWPNGCYCPHCENYDKKPIYEIAANPAKKIRAGLRHCRACNKQFTVTVGTIFEDSKIPLRKWLIAWYLLCASKKGISALQVQRMLGLGSYRTAWMMMHKIRYALKDPAFQGKLSGVVEVDETWVGGKRKNVGRGFFKNKTAVVSLVERGGKARSQVIKRITSANLKKVINDNIEKSATLMTDDRRQYVHAGRKFARHESVNHSAGEYARGDANTNTVEGFFSILKRGVMGSFHHISEKHLPLYLAEFDFRYNNRNVTDGMRTFTALKFAEGKRLTYKPLVADAKGLDA